MPDDRDLEIELEFPLGRPRPAGDTGADMGAARLVIPARDLQWTAVRSPGPGGQNVNKVASKVDLRFDVNACESISAAIKQRLRALPGARFDAEGRLVITSTATRNQSRNLDDARAKLAALVRAAAVEPKRRRKTRPSTGSKRRRLDTKRARASTKAARGRVATDD